MVYNPDFLMPFKIVTLALMLFFSSLFLSAQTGSEKTYGPLALQETVIPVRPGVPGVLPFWNGNSRQFIYAPAFDYKMVDKADKYRFEIVSSDGSKQSFESKVPFAPLSPVWTKIQVGFFNVKVTGVSATGETLCIAGEREAYNVTKKDMYLAKAKSIANTFTVVQNEHNGDYPTLFSKYKSNFWLNSVVYPAKMMMLLENNLKELNR